MATLLSIDYHVPFTIPEGAFVKTGHSVSIEQNPPTPIGTGAVFYRCFELDDKGKKKLTFRWISADMEVSLQS